MDDTARIYLRCAQNNEWARRGEPEGARLPTLAHVPGVSISKTYTTLHFRSLFEREPNGRVSRIWSSGPHMHLKRRREHFVLSVQQGVTHLGKGRTFAPAD